ncbi:MAG: CDP-alcohol phosphatidyltransferase family protein [Chlorobiota bacterium]
MEWTLSNILSLLRLLLVFPFAWLLVQEATVGVLLVGGIAILSDIADGMVARWQGQVTELGKVLDPVADKLLAGVAASILVLQQKLPLWFALVVIGRDALLLLGGWLAWRWGKVVLPALPAGKWTALAIAGTLFASYLRWEDWLAVGIALSVLGMISSTGIYARRWWEQFQRRSGD